MHWVSGNLSQEQQLVQATQANESLRQAYRNEATAKFDATERLRKMREALEKMLLREFEGGGVVTSLAVQRVLDEFA